MKQVLAVAVAALLIALAIVVRGALDDDGGTDDEAVEPGGDDGGEELVVACIPELRTACEALEDVTLRIEDPADTIAAPDEVDAWVTFDPWPAIAGFGDDVPRPLAEDVVPVGFSELVLLSRADAIEACPTPTTWTCVVDASDRVNAPQGALGPLVLGAAGIERFGGPFSGNDLDADTDGIDTFLRRIGTDIADPVEEMLLLGRAGPHAAGTTQADAALRVDPSPRGEGIDTSATGAFAAVVVAGAAADRIAGDEALRDGLAAAGYADGELPAANGLPSPGVLFRLQELL